MQFPKQFQRLVETMDAISVVIVSIFVLIIGYRPPWWMKKKTDGTKTVSSIPGPIALPVLGTKWVFSWIGGYRFDLLHEFYRDMFKKHGPIIKEAALWNIPVISIVDKNDIEKVMRASGKYPLRPPTEVIAYYRRTRPDRYASTGLVNEQGETWYHLRSALTNDLTSPKTIAGFISTAKEVATDFVALIRQQRDENDRIMQFEKLAHRLGLEMVCALVLGRRMGLLSPRGESKISARFEKAVLNHLVACRNTYYGLPFWKVFPSSSYDLLVEAEEEIYNLVSELTSSLDSSVNDSVIFKSIINADIDEREKTAAIVDFVASGIHTLGNSLIFLMHLVSTRSDIQLKLIEEDNSALLRACVNEAFRLLPTAPCVARITEKDLELSGYHVPAGNVILCQTGLACRNSENFPVPLEFRPERWIDEDKSPTTTNSTYLVLPFGCGRRSCPGKRFVEQTLPVLLDSVVRNFQIASDKELEVRFEFLMGAKSPIEMVFVERN